MKDRESLIFFLLGVGLVLLIVGIFYRKWNIYYKFKPRTTIQRFFSELLGERGSQIWIMFIAITLFLLPAAYLSYVHYIKPKLPAEYSQKTEDIALRHIVKSNRSHDGWIISAPVEWTTVNHIQQRLSYTDLHIYDSISFRDNYLEELPDFIWKMSNLKHLNLKNNKIISLPIETIKKSPLSHIYITGNPIDKNNLIELKSLGITIVNEE